MNKPMSLVVFLARAGLGSRRSCDELVRSGVVTVNGAAVDFPRFRLAGDEVVAVNGEPVELRELRYVLVSKPRGVASTRRDPHAERVIVDLVPNGRTLFPVGRLDVDTTGLIILTNDGVLANHLMHPRYGVPKTYVARVRGKVSRRALAMLRQGLELDDGPTAPAEVNLKKQSAKTALVEITIHEGRKRQVRRMFEAVGLPVEELHRRRYGPLTDKGLEPGGLRDLTDEEVDALRRAGEEVVQSSTREVEGESLFLSAEVETLETEAVKVVSTPTRAERRGSQPETVPASLAESEPQPETETLDDVAQSASNELESEPALPAETVAPEERDAASIEQPAFNAPVDSNPEPENEAPGDDGRQPESQGEGEAATGAVEASDAAGIGDAADASGAAEVSAATEVGAVEPRDADEASPVAAPAAAAAEAAAAPHDEGAPHDAGEAADE